MTNDDCRERFEQLLSPGGKILGTEFLSYDEAAGTVRLSFKPTDEFKNVLGIMHGGFVAAMLDEVAGLAGRLALPQDKAVPTLTLNVTFFSPTPISSLIGEAKVLKLGRTTAVIEAKLLSPEGKIFAMAGVTAAVTATTP